MITVTLEEARDRLPELIAKMATGEQVVIADDGKWVAALATPPPKPPTPEEIAAQEKRAWEAVQALRRLRNETTEECSPDLADVKRMAAQLDFIRSVVESHDLEGNPLPVDHPLRAMIARRSAG